MEYRVNFQGVVMNVADLNRSIDFYREVLDFTVLTQSDQMATVSAPESEQPQIIVLRAFGSGRKGGARNIGLRGFILEVGSTDQLEKIAREMDSRSLFVSRRSQDEWSAIVGRDPDGVAVVIGCASGLAQISKADWARLDDYLYGIGE
jgi:catechol-2,3-dioxygenase